jgi:outer membrane protein
MKKLFLLASLVMVAFTFTANAQTKFGHIDIQQLIQVMPERQAAMKELEKTAGELEEMLGTMNTELQTMYQQYIEKRDSLSDLVRQAKEEDINAKQQRIETFRSQADQQLQQKQGDLMKPIIEKADKTIAEVAKEMNLLYVFDISSRVVLYKSTESVDVLPLVKKKMGIQ